MKEKKEAGLRCKLMNDRPETELEYSLAPEMRKQLKPRYQEKRWEGDSVEDTSHRDKGQDSA